VWNTEQHPQRRDIQKTNDDLKWNQQEAILNLETSLQRTMFSNGGLWPVAAMSPSSHDVSSPHVCSKS
jgi:hypothetical protein